MNKLLRLLLIFCLAFTPLESNAMKSTKDLQGKLGTLKTNLANLKSKLTTLSKKLKRLNRALTKPKKIKATITTLPKFDEDDRDKYALYGDFTDISSKFKTTLVAENHPFEGYGFKTANLKELEKISDYLNTKKLPLKIAVPSFIGISSREVKKILSKIGISLDEKWSTLLSESKYTKQVPNLENFSDTFLTGLKKLADEIKKAFVTNANDAEKILKSSLEPKNWTPLQKFLRDNASKRLMVRSTGREDTKELANAGGNESIANVLPTFKDIFLAMGMGAKEDQWGVVSSYFGEKSMRQRLGAKDKHLFDNPLVPVLIQVMIGEKEGGEEENTPDKITRCGVLYTEETEGSLYKITNKTITSGITLIQASYGHNEGVVNSIVPVDSYYIDEQSRIYTIDRPKTFRLVPTPQAEKITAGVVKRKDHKDSKIIYRPALTKAMIEGLKAVAQATEAYYSMPMDIEFVIDVENKTINLVQARPIVIPDTPPASYLKNIEQYKDCANIDDIIVASGGALRFITSPDQIIAEKSINQALNNYHSSKQNQNKVQCILIEEKAPATSHEAATFRGEGKPVVYVKSLSSLEKWLQELKTGSTKLVIDLQQNKIVKWTGTESNIEQLISNEKADQSWISYPISKTVSLVPPFPQLLDVAQKNFESLVKKTYPSMTVQSVADNYKKDNKELNYNFFTEKIKTAKSKEEAQKAIFGLWIITTYQVSKISKDLLTLYASEIPLLLRFMQFYLYKIYSNWLFEGFDTTKKEDVLKLLFQINFLQAILYQPSMEDIVNGFSFGQIIAKDESERKWAETQLGTDVKFAPEITQLMRLGIYALTDELRNKWRDFIKELDPSSEKYKKLSQIILEANKFGIVELWFNTIFAETDTPGNNVDEWHKDFFDNAGKSKALIQKFNTYKQKIDALNLDGLSSPSRFLKVWNDFQKNILDYFISDKFKSDFAGDLTSGEPGASRVEKFIAISMMEKFISKYDAAIKAMENSKEFKIVNYPMKKNIRDIIKNENNNLIETEIKENQNRIFTFSFMLYYYFTILQNWYNILALPPIAEPLPDYGWTPNETSVEIALHFIVGPFWKTLLDCSQQTNNPDQLEVRKDGGFNVDASMIGSKTDIKRANLKTLEEVFTFTHQGVLIILGKLLNKYGPKDKYFPEVVQSLIKQIKALGDSVCALSKTFKNGLLEIKYNWPQFNHSAQIEIDYNVLGVFKQKSMFKIAVKFFGIDRYARFAKAADVAEVFNSYYRFMPDKAIVEINLPENEIECSWLMQGDNSVIEYIINCMNILSAQVDTIPEPNLLLNVLYNVKPKPDSNYVLKKIIEISAQENRSRTCFGLDEILLQPLFVPTQQQKILLQSILSKLKDAQSDYSINTKIFFYQSLLYPFFTQVKYYDIRKDKFNLEDLLKNPATSEKYKYLVQSTYEESVQRYEELKNQIKKVIGEA